MPDQLAIGPQTHLVQRQLTVSCVISTGAYIHCERRFLFFIQLLKSHKKLRQFQGTKH